MKTQTNNSSANVKSMKDMILETSKEEMVQLSRLFADMFGMPSEIELDHVRHFLYYAKSDLSIGKNLGALSAKSFLEQWNKDIDILFDHEDPLILEESVYKAWTNEKNHPLRGARGHSHGDPAAHMEAVLAIFGISAESYLGGSPDSLATLFEFLGFLLEKRPSSEALTFCRDHLDWLDTLEEKAVELNAGMTLKCVICTANIFVKYLIDKMEIHHG